ncbi:MAG: tetratricopeptide repeat protein [Phormidesmis sp.]
MPLSTHLIRLITSSSLLVISAPEIIPAQASERTHEIKELGNALPTDQQAVEILEQTDERQTLISTLLTKSREQRVQAHEHVQNDRQDEAEITYQQAVETVQSALNIAQELEDPVKIYDALNHLTEAYIESAQFHSDQALSWQSKENNDLAEEQFALTETLSKKSIESALEALSQVPKIKNETTVSQIYNTVLTAYQQAGRRYQAQVLTYSEAGDFEAAEATSRKTIEMWETEISQAIAFGETQNLAFRKVSLAVIYNFLSQTQAALEKYEEGIETTESALDILADTNARELKINILNSQLNHYYTLSDLSYKNRDYDQALDFSTRALHIAQQMLTLSEKAVQVAGEDFLEGEALYAYIDSEEERQEKIEFTIVANSLIFHQFAQSYAEQNNHEKAIEYRTKAVEMHQRLGQDEQVFSNLLLIIYNHLAIGQYSKALAIAAEAEMIAQTLDDQSILLRAKTSTARVYDEMARYIEATELYEEALTLATVQNKTEQADTIRNNLGVIATAQGRYADALNTFKASITPIQEKRQRATEATTWSELNDICFKNSATDDTSLSQRSAFAIRAENNSLEQQRQTCLSSTWDSELKSLSNIAHVYTSQGRYQEAIATYQEALEITREWGTPSQKGGLLNNISVVYFEKGDYPTSLRLSQEALAIFQSLDEPINIAFGLNSIGVTYWTQGEYGKALANYEQVLEILKEVEHKPLESGTYSNIALVYSAQGRYAEAKSLLQRALSIDKQLQLLPNQSIRFISLAHIAREKGDYPTALAYLEESLSLQKQMGDRAKRSGTLVSMGLIHERQGSYAEALSAYEEGLAIAQSTQDLDDEANARLALGRVYSKLGQNGKAQTFYQDSLDILKRIGDTTGEAVVLTQLGENADKQSQYAEALSFYKSALALHQRTGNVGEESSVLLKLGLTQINQGDITSADANLQQSLDIQDRIGSQKNKADTLAGLARIASERGNLENASAQLQQALFLHKELGDKDGEAAVLTQIGNLLTQQNRPALAIIFYKQSVNIIEDIRSDLSGLLPEIQQSFTGTVSGTYRSLADLLLQQNRVLEAQQVLDLLRVQELEDYLENVRGNAITAGGVEYQPAEQAILAEYQRRQETAIELAQERTTLNAKAKDGTITQAEEARRNKLFYLLQEITNGFNAFASSPDITQRIEQLVSDTEGQTIRLTQLSGLRNQLSELDAALIYPLILEDRTEIVITTAGLDPLRRTVEGVGRKEINDAVTAYRQALQDPSSDATTPAQQLYKMLIVPLEADLAAAGVETIIYSPDGALRYIPLAALHDGQQWMAERFKINNITATSLQSLVSEPQAQPNILAGAYADRSLIWPARGADYSGLPSAGLEVNLLNKMMPETTTALFDKEFSVQATIPNIELYNVLHFATHASFVAGNPEESFILFGSGETQTLKQIESWPLSNVDLVVLSACETGLGQFDNNGEQILGLGYQFQERGANAVIASLWQVNDGSTQVLMNDFYTQLGQGMSKNEAVQKAQIAMIESDLTVADAINRSGLEVLNTETGEAVANSTGKVSHPHYWAPFILIGNGL